MPRAPVSYESESQWWFSDSQLVQRHQQPTDHNSHTLHNIHTLWTTATLFWQAYPSPPTTIAQLQRVQNAAARLVARLGLRDHVTSTIRDLHWLPVQHRITYKLCLMMHLVNIGRAPMYLINSITATRDVVSRSRLRSSSSHRYEQPRTRHKLGERSFSFAGPAAWNSLPPSLHALTNTVTFKNHLKTHLFTRAFGP